jgi:hypothetical protein
MRHKRNPYRILVGEPEGKIPFGDLGVDGSIILTCIINK